MSQHPRILVLSTSYPIKGVSDAGHFVQSECHALSEKGLKINVLAPAHPLKMGKALEGDVEVTRFKYFFPTRLQRLAYGAGIPNNLKSSWLAFIQLPFFFYSFYRSAKKLSKEADILHCHWFPAGLIAALVKKKDQKLVLMMHHGHKPSMLYRWILKKCDYLFTNSIYTAEKTAEIYKVPNQNILHLGIDTDAFKPPIEGRNSTKAFKVLFVGRLIDWKGTEYLIKAFSIYLKKSSSINAQLVIIGDGPLRTQLESLSKSLGISEKIIFKGYVNRNELAAHFQESDVFCIPSIKLSDGETEGLGLTAIEACACELPVIGSKTGGIVDIIEDGKNGFLVPPGNEEAIAEKIDLLYTNDALRHEMGKEGRRIILERFSLKKNADLIFSAYQKIRE